MARPRKYKTEEERLEARRTAGRNRGARHRAKQHEMLAGIAAMVENRDVELPTNWDDQPPPLPSSERPPRKPVEMEGSRIGIDVVLPDEGAGRRRGPKAATKD